MLFFIVSFNRLASMQNILGSYIISKFPSDPFINISKEILTENENCQRTKPKTNSKFILCVYFLMNF